MSPVRLAWCCVVIPRNEIALALELRVEGCCWKRIAQGLGHDPDALRLTVKNAVRDGFAGDARIVTPDWALQAARTMRADGLGWRSIAAHLSQPEATLRERYYRLRKTKR